MTEQPKKIKVLGLHGMGTSAHILKSQTVALRAKLPAHFTFDFIDAPFHCAPAPGTDILFDSGHYAWWTHPTVNGIRGAHQVLDDYVEAHGPVDVVLGFSQGCSLIGSYLLYHARETPELPLPFKAAVFACGGMPLPVLEDLGVAVSPRAKAINDLTSKLMKKKAGVLVEMAAHLDRIQPGVGLWDDVAGLLHNPDEMPDEKDVFGLDFTAMPADLRIKIPTVHVYGAKDPRWPASLQLAYFCDNKKVYDHRGGHDIPRSTEVSRRIAEMVEALGKEIQGK
ncbi:family of serine hydrolases 1 [Chaetomidium leptoderma]|uniref:Family of serine hydrolases 1 n=1 Tax=Chaetomidium leptoderma TaxID=669021 RepID=A0AAN6VHD4_9PEZI|nr:family of serine hydrolases 1 [Chaetomidium leptoderma]